MPPKKKTISKKKKETVADRKQWVDHGRKDAKGFSKALPETAQALKSGEMGVNEAAKRLALLGFEEQLGRGQAVRVPRKGRPNEQVDWIEALVAALCQKVIPVVSTATLTLTCESYDELCDTFHKKFLQKDLIQRNGSALQEAFDEVTEHWESCVQSLTGRPLKETCPLYKVSLETFTIFVNNYVAENFDNAKFKEAEEEIKNVMAQVVTRYTVVKRAAQGVVDGEVMT